jgi:hypothetical protein
MLIVSKNPVNVNMERVHICVRPTERTQYPLQKPWKFVMRDTGQINLLTPISSTCSLAQIQFGFIQHWEIELWGGEWVSISRYDIDIVKSTQVEMQEKCVTDSSNAQTLCSHTFIVSLGCHPDTRHTSRSSNTQCYPKCSSRYLW